MGNYMEKWNPLEIIAAGVVLGECGKLIVDNVYRGFDQTVLQQIKDYLNPMQNITGPQVQELPVGNSKE